MECVCVCVPKKEDGTYFLVGAIFCRFHILSVWSSEAVTSTGSVGWKASARTESKWLRSVNLGFHVLRRSWLVDICCRGGMGGWRE